MTRFVKVIGELYLPPSIANLGEEERGRYPGLKRPVSN
jgi:hypothetical protein